MGFLDGLRGLASAWVVAGHACILTGLRLPLVQSPNYAVDLFMLISGFLMYFQARLRANTEPFGHYSSWIFFWIRRFFRLSPIYYVAFLTALLFGAELGQWRETIAVAVPETATPVARYADQSWQNVLAHISYVFGALPHYAFRTALPDWSIGLEMEFYLVFPLLFVTMTKIGAIRSTAICCALAASMWIVAPGYLRSFEMPAFLALKINLFLAGMLIAAFFTERKSSPVLLIVALFVAGLPLEGVITIKSVLMRMALAGTVTVLAAQQNEFLGNRFFFWLGELSYSVYLIHLLVMLPVAALVAQAGIEQAWLRFVLCIVAVGVVVYPVSWALLNVIEIPGRKFGRDLIQRFKQRRAPAV
jgi:peptidoglycan/LPS O-acetylase OafA/YrhL